jgi:4-diphosphocytidyl-2-C-methyl-D-erythritol kinase
MSPAVRIPAFAKVNLDLRVLATRDDGYHDLATIFQTVALHDTLTFTGGVGAFEIRCNTTGVPRDRSNLVWRAAEALWLASGRPDGMPPVRIDLDKSIPAAAGLGGGSADAAAALCALDALWTLGLSPRRLHDIAARLGADVAFFLRGGTALGRGRGDDLETLPDLPSWPVVIARPAFGVSTREAYAWFDADGTGGSPALAPPDTSAGWPACLDRCVNDLERPVARRHPQIGALIGALRGSGARLAMMSGSGSAVFGLFADGRAAAEAAATVPAAAVWTTRVLPGAVYRAAFRPVPAESGAGSLPGPSGLV